MAKIYKIAEDYDVMKKWFEKRTQKHIDTVAKYCEKLSEYDPKRFGGILERIKDHDQSKFKDPELEPYIYITWKYKCKAEGVDFSMPEGMADKADEATEHHIINETHHPEHWCGRTTNLINKKDRDKPPTEMVDATKMSDLDIGEMVCDWCAVSEERGNHPKTWADKNVNIRWKFTDEQKDLIYELIGGIFK